MKLKSYFLLSIVVGMTFACSSDENVPEVEVFTPDATLSLATVADEKTLTKAEEETNIDPENAINTLHVMVFYSNSTLQTDRVVSNRSQVEELEVQSGAVKILVLANAEEGQFGTLTEALAYQRSLDKETLANGFSMSSKLIDADLEKGMHNVFGDPNDFPAHILIHTNRRAGHRVSGLFS